jgi:CRP-like cAMP-binding protein
MDDMEDTGVVLEEEEITALEIRTYEESAEILTEGESSERFFVVLGGKVRICRHGRRLRVLGEGDVFGLENCMLERPSSFSAVAMGGTRIATYGRDAIDFILYERPQMSFRLFTSLVAQLSQTTEAVAREEPAPTVDSVDLRFYDDGQVIIEEGARDTDIFKLVSTEHGLVVTKDGRQIGEIRSPGEFFGEMASALNQVRSATIFSRGKSVVQVYAAEHIQDMIEEHPEVARRMISTLAKRLSHAIRIISKLQRELDERTR